MLIQRAGDVIPQVISVIEGKAGERAKPYVFPKRCPVCDSLATRDEGEVARRCTGGLVCPAQAVERLRHFVSRDAFDIEGLGTRHILAMWEDGLIARPGEIFRLGGESQNLLEREGWGERSAENLLAAIEERLERLRSPFRAAEAFRPEEIIDPRDTRPLLCEFAEMAAPLRNPGKRRRGFRP